VTEFLLQFAEDDENFTPKIELSLPFDTKNEAIAAGKEIELTSGLPFLQAVEVYPMGNIIEKIDTILRQNMSQSSKVNKLTDALIDDIKNLQKRWFHVEINYMEGKKKKVFAFIGPTHGNPSIQYQTDQIMNRLGLRNNPTLQVHQQTIPVKEMLRLTIRQELSSNTSIEAQTEALHKAIMLLNS
jgi:hypothetical protein